MIAVTASSLLSEELNVRKLFEGYLRKPITRAGLYSELARLLPTEGTRTSASPLPASLEAAQAPVDVARWRELVVLLRNMERTTWPLLSRSMGTRETEAFARELASAADHAACGPLADYAGKLLAEVLAFDIQAEEKTMKLFPELVDGIDRLTGEASS